jgi:D-amino-acid dehydrogenase
MGDTIVIVGAGIVGIASAALLAEAGHDVTVVDRTGICEETSSGNAAALAFTEVLPLAQKGVWKKMPAWLVDPLGPLSIPPSYLPRLLPWLMRFALAGNPRRHDAAVAAQVALMRLAESEWMALIGRAGLNGMLIEKGCLELYDTAASFRAARAGYDLRERHGIAFRHLSRDAIADYQPGLSPHFAAGTFVPGWKNVSDPKDFGQAVWAHAVARGARFVKGTVAKLGLSDGTPQIVLADGQVRRADHLVLAAGAWSHRLAAPMGDHFPLETERGYNTTLPSDAFDVRLQLVFADHGFVVTPLSTGLRIGGAVELGGVDAPPNYARSRAMLEKTRRFLPGLKSAGGREWMGYRPSLPDSLPVIGRSKASPHLLYAFGHGHLGLTQAAATGRLIRELISGEAPAIDLAPFSPYRF